MGQKVKIKEGIDELFTDYFNEEKIHGIKNDALKFDAGVKAAATRVRKEMMVLIKAATKIRKDIITIRKSRESEDDGRVRR